MSRQLTIGRRPVYLDPAGFYRFMDDREVAGTHLDLDEIQSMARVYPNLSRWGLLRAAQGRR